MSSIKEFFKKIWEWIKSLHIHIHSNKDKKCNKDKITIE